MDEAVTILAEVAAEDGRVLAGGQSLVPMMAFRLAQPGHLVDINGVASLRRLRREQTELSIGACVRHADFHKPATEGPLGRLLSEVAGNIAHYPIRMRGAFCGSLAHADPSSEWCLVAATLGAEIRAQSVRGGRAIPAEAFFHGMMSTDLAPDELLTQARLPLLPPDTAYGFHEFSRRAGDYALAAALAVYRLKDGKIDNARLGICGAEARPRRISEAETILNGAQPSPRIFRDAAEIAAASIEPVEDAQVSAAFRRTLVRTVTERALARTLQEKLQ